MTIQINSTKRGVADIAREAVKELIKEAPEDWTEKVATLMGKTPITVKQYVSGVRGDKRKKAIVQVLIHLKRVVEDYKEEVNQLATLK